MRRTSYALAFLLCIVVGVIAESLPASATVNAGPWDASIDWWSAKPGGDPTHDQLYYEVRMSVDSDDYADTTTATGARYRACIQFTDPSGGTGIQQPTMHSYANGAWVGGPISGVLGNDQLPGTGQSASTTGHYTVTKVWIVPFSGGLCSADNEANGLTLRAYTPTRKLLPSNRISTTVSGTPVTPSPSGSTIAFDATPGTAACSRTLSAVNGSNVADFKGTTSGGTNMTVTNGVWHFGDGSTDKTITGAGAYDNSYIYPALSSMPTDGWTASLTVTYTVTSGHYFSDGTSTHTSVCSLRIDFVHPSLSTPGSSGSSGETTGSPSLDACIPSGWSLLNPFAWIGGIGCMLQVLFVPSSATTDSLSAMWGDLTTKAPFSVIYEAVTFIPGQVNDMITGIGHAPGTGQSTVTCGATLNGGHAFSNVAGAGHNTGACDDNGHLMVGGMTYDSGTVDLVWYIHNGALFILGGLFFYACYRGLAEVLK